MLPDNRNHQNPIKKKTKKNLEGEKRGKWQEESYIGVYIYIHTHSDQKLTRLAQYLFVMYQIQNLKEMEGKKKNKRRCIEYWERESPFEMPNHRGMMELEIHPLNFFDFWRLRSWGETSTRFLSHCTHCIIESGHALLATRWVCQRSYALGPARISSSVHAHGAYVFSCDWGMPGSKNVYAFQPTHI